MAKRKIIRKSNKPLNIYENGGDMSDFEDFINSDTFQGIQKGVQAFNFGASSSQGQPSFLSMGQSSGKGLYGAIGSTADTTGQLLSGIDSLLTKKRKSLAQTVGLISSSGERLYAKGGDLNLGAGDYVNMGTTALQLAGNALQQAQIADTSELKSQIKQYGNAQIKSNNFDDLMSDWESRTELQHISARDLRNKSLFGDFANSLSASGKGFSAGSVAGPWGAAIGGVVGGVSSVVGSLIGRSKAKREAARVNKQIDIANARNLQAFEDKAQNIDIQNDINAMTNFAAFGGPLDVWGYGNGAIGYELAKENLGIKAMDALSKNKITSLPNSFTELNTFADGGSIHIKPSKRGTFTAAAKKHGKGVQEFARQVLANKENYSPAMVKKANFARNFGGRKRLMGGFLEGKEYADGGPLMSNGAVWDNGLTYIGNGGTHEENPMEGVPMGVDNQGTPNLVEQGEVIFNDYVFSNRLAVPNAIRSKYKLRGNKEMTFADAAKKMAKESEERPNDPISKRGLMDSMSKLQQAQEMVKQNTVGQEEKRKYAYGGRKVNKFDGLDSDTMFLDGVDYGDWQDYGTLLEPISGEDLWDKAMAGSDAGGENPNKSSKLTWLRYAPVVGSALGVAQNLFSRPDYSNANAILEAANDAGNYNIIGYTPIGNYLQYRPLDRNYYINKLGAQAGATRRAIMNTTSPSRNAALLAADYNAQGRLGDLMRQAEEYDLAQRQAVETFNRGTNISNAEMGLKAAMANQEAALKAKSSRLSGVAQAMSMRDAIAARRSASLSSNLSNLFESLGNIGIDEYNREDRDKLIRAGVFGTLSEKPQEWSNKRWEDYKKAVSGTGYRNGGKLKKKRGGFTY